MTAGHNPVTHDIVGKIQLVTDSRQHRLEGNLKWISNRSNPFCSVTFGLFSIRSCFVSIQTNKIQHNTQNTGKKKTVAFDCDINANLCYISCHSTTPKCPNLRMQMSH